MKIIQSSWICDFLEENPLEELLCFLLDFSEACAVQSGDTHPLGYFLLIPFHFAKFCLYCDDLPCLVVVFFF